MSLLWRGARPECPGQDCAHPPPGSLSSPRLLGKREKLTCQVSLLGLCTHLAAPVIGKLADLSWVHVIHLLSCLMGNGTYRRPSAGRRAEIVIGWRYFPDFGNLCLMTPSDLCHVAS